MRPYGVSCSPISGSCGWIFVKYELNLCFLAKNTSAKFCSDPSERSLSILPTDMPTTPKVAALAYKKSRFARILPGTPWFWRFSTASTFPVWEVPKTIDSIDLWKHPKFPQGRSPVGSAHWICYTGPSIVRSSQPNLWTPVSCAIVCSPQMVNHSAVDMQAKIYNMHMWHLG